MADCEYGLEALKKMRGREVFGLRVGAQNEAMCEFCSVRVVREKGKIVVHGKCPRRGEDIQDQIIDFVNSLSTDQ